MDLGMLLRKKLDILNDIKWKYMQKQIVYIVLGYLQLAILKKMEEYDEVTVLFEALK